MIKKILAVVLILAVAIGAYFAFSGKNEEASDNTQQTTADGYDLLKGTWYVGAIYYNNRLYDISDNDALTDLYDTTFIAFREDGTFTFSNIYMKDGTYTRKESSNGKDVFMLKTDRVYLYTFEEGKMVETDKEDGTKTSYLVTMKSEDTLELVEMDPMTGAAKADDMPMIFELSGEESDYVSSNKTPLNNTTTTKKETTTRKETTTKRETTTRRETTTKKPEYNYNSGSSAGQRNALEAAKRYLSAMPFSHKGLIEQLEYEGYTYSEAKYAADNCGADWYAQAVKHAKQYLDTMPFSRSDLISQLEYEGYTYDQAVYGVNQSYN